MFMLIFLVSCGTSNSTDKGDFIVDSNFSTAGFITQMSANKLLVADIFLSTKPDTDYETDMGEPVARKDLKAGMKVQVLINGPIMESYPAKAKAAQVTILTDEESEKESKAVKILLKTPKIGSQVIIRELSWLNESTAEIRYTENLLDWKKAEVDIEKEEILLIEDDSGEE